MSKWNGLRIVALSILLSAPLLSCRTLDAATSETTPYGTQLRERIDQWDRWCKGEKLGPYNDDPRRKQITTCDFLFLKDKRWDPDADEFSRYAHSIKLPPPHDKPQAVYRAGMSSREYFEELCAKEGGEWIFRTVAGVKGVLQARTRIDVPSGLNQLVPFAREPTPPGSADDLQWPAMAGKSNFIYRFFEYPDGNDRKAIRIHRYYRSEVSLKEAEPNAQVLWRQHASGNRVPYVVADTALSAYAYIGRGVLRTEFEIHGVVGTELLVVNRRTSDVLAFVRLFTSIRPIATAPWGLSTESIHRTCDKPADFTSSPDFVLKVLLPE